MVHHERLLHFFIDFPQAGNITSDSVELNVSSTAGDIDQWFFFNNSGLLNFFTPNITINNLPQGTNNITVFVNDTFGNFNSSQVILFIDSNAPLIEFVAPTLADDTNTTVNTQIIANVTVVELNEVNITFVITNSTGTVNDTTFTSSVRFFNHSQLLNDGIYEYNVTVCDFNICNTTETRTLRIDTTPPDLFIAFPTNSSFSINTLDLNVSSTATDISIWTWSNDSGATNNSFVPNITISNLPDGSNTIIVFVNDTLNNENQE